MEETLILDQPDQVTTAGKVEHVVKKPSKKKKLNETMPPEDPQNNEVLLNDAPIDGVEILLD